MKVLRNVEQELPLEVVRSQARRFYFSHVGGRDWVTVLWGGYEYDIEMDRIPDPMALLQWVAHLGQKTWPGMTAQEISAFIERICERKGWTLWTKV